MNGDNVTFTPRSQQCNVATLTPASANSSTSIAASTPLTPPPAQAVQSVPVASTSGPSAPTAASPAANTPTPSSATRAAMRVLATEFSPGANPMVGQSIFIMRERMDEVLRYPVQSNPATGSEEVLNL